MGLHQAPFPETILAQQHAPFVFTLAWSPTHHAAFCFSSSSFFLVVVTLLSPSTESQRSWFQAFWEKPQNTLFLPLSLRWERRLVGSNPWARQQEVMDMASLQAPKLYHVHTHLSLLSLFPPTSPPSSPLSLFSLSRGSKAKRKQARKEQSTHQRVWENLISGRYPGRMIMPGIFHKHAK